MEITGSAGGKPSTFDFSSLNDPLEDSADSELFASSGDNCTEEDTFFDTVVGAIENILMDEDFLEMQQSFCEENCDVFDDDDENKMVYTELFGKYTEMIEGFLEERIAQEVPGFSMDRFGGMLGERQDEITGDVFDMLMSFTEFSEFKELMLSYKAQAGGMSMDGGLGGLSGVGANIDSCLGIVSKENLGAVGSGVLALSNSPQKKKPASTKRDAFDPLSPASREAKDSAVSP
jgi:ADP-ribosylation factor 2-binding protein